MNYCVVGCGALRALALAMKRAKEGEAFELEPLLLDAVNSFLLLLAQSVGITVEVTELVKYIAKEIFSFYEAGTEDSSFNSIPLSFASSIIFNFILLVCLLVAVFKIKNPQTTFGTRLCKRKRSPRRRGIRRPVKDDTPDVDLSDIKIVETAV